MNHPHLAPGEIRATHALCERLAPLRSTKLVREITHPHGSPLDTLDSMDRASFYIGNGLPGRGGEILQALLFSRIIDSSREEFATLREIAYTAGKMRRLDARFLSRMTRGNPELQIARSERDELRQLQKDPTADPREIMFRKAGMQTHARAAVASARKSITAQAVAFTHAGQLGKNLQAPNKR